MRTTFLLFVSLITLLSAPLAHAETKDSFAHLTGATANSGVDFFTRRENQSELTRIQNLLVALKKHKKILLEVQRRLPTGVRIVEEIAEYRTMILSKFGMGTEPNYDVAPSSIQGHWVLSIKNDRVLSELLEAMGNEILIYDFMTSNDLFRLVIEKENSAHRDHLIVGKGTPKKFTNLPQIEEEGLVRLFDRSNSSLNLRSDFLDQAHFHISEFIPERNLGSLFSSIMTEFWYQLSLRCGGFDSPRFLSIIRSSLAVLGFSGVDKIMPSQMISAYHMIYYTNMLAVMGYRFNPASSNTGYYSFIESSAERERYKKFIFKLNIPPLWQNSINAMLEAKFYRFYEQAAAAFKVLGDLDRMPSPRGEREPFSRLSMDSADEGLPHLSYVESPTDAVPFWRPLIMMDVIRIVENKFPGALDKQIKEGREKNWNFATEVESCRKNLTSSKQRRGNI